MLEIAAKMPRKQSAASRILDENEDGAFHMGLKKRGKSALAKKVQRETDLMEMLTEGKSGADARADTTTLSWEVSASSNPAFMKYWNWQVDRKASEGPEDTSAILSKVVRSKMGRFALLPGELRNKIYRHALVNEFVIFPVTGMFEVEGEFAVKGIPNQCNLGPCSHTRLSQEVPELLSTCKQIRHEALPILLAENKIHFDSKTVRYRCTGNFLRSLGPYARFIRHVTLDIMVWVPIDPLLRVRRHLRRQDRFSIHIKCPTACGEKFEVHVDEVIAHRVKFETRQYLQHVEEVNGRVDIDKIEHLLIALICTDRVAELVWKCDQGRY